jgi:hypothetical protein
MAGTNKTAAAAARKLQRQADALELRRAGHSYASIARSLSLSKSRAHALVQDAMQYARQQVAVSVDELRALEVSRLDAMLQGVWAKARRGEMKAIDRVLKIGERRARLLGLDAPAKVAGTVLQGNPPGPRVIELVAPSVVAEAKVTFYIPDDGRP